MFKILEKTAQDIENITLFTQFQITQFVFKLSHLDCRSEKNMMSFSFVKFVRKLRKPGNIHQIYANP